MLRNLTTALIERGQVTTTDAKAKELRKVADRMITLGKRRTIAARRRARRFIMTDGALKYLFDEVAPRFEARRGGYTRVIKLGRRKGDNAALSVVELTEREVQSD